MDNCLYKNNAGEWTSFPMVQNRAVKPIFSIQGLKTTRPACEHTRILRALVKHPQGNLEEIQQKTLQSTQEEPVGRQDRKA
jgi:hypothetical protein